MKKFLSGFSIVGLSLLLMCFVCVVGCEDDDDDDNSSPLRLIPASATIPVGVSSNVAMSVLNGTAPYTWSISMPALGSIVAAGSTAIYTSGTNAGQQTVIVLDSQTNTVTGVITHN